MGWGWGWGMEERSDWFWTLTRGTRCCCRKTAELDCWGPARPTGLPSSKGTFDTCPIVADNVGTDAEVRLPVVFLPIRNCPTLEADSTCGMPALSLRLPLPGGN